MMLRFGDWGGWWILGVAAVLAVACSPQQPALTVSPGPTLTAGATVGVTEEIVSGGGAAAAVSQPTPTRVETPETAAAVIPEATVKPLGEVAVVVPWAQRTGAFLDRFIAEMSPRESATEEEAAAADYLAAELEGLGYEAGLQPFTFERLSRRQKVEVTGGETFRSVPLRFTGFGTVSGELAEVGLGKEGEVSKDSVSGRIALIGRGEITFEEKTTRVAEAGAVGVIIFNNEDGVFRGQLRDQADIPVVAIRRADGERLLRLMGEGEVEVTIAAEAETKGSRNIIAERTGGTGNGKVVIIGAHYDTTPDTQGANDNGSGVAALLTVAEELVADDLPFRLRFMLFGAEELGLYGSRHYVDGLDLGELDSIIAMINIDAVGSGTRLEIIGEDWLVDPVVDYAELHGIPVREQELSRWGGSDHASFRDAEVATLFLIGSDLSRINSPEDDIEFVRRELMGAAAALALESVAQLAREE